jgi:protein PhnA
MLLNKRSNSLCELCSSSNSLSVYSLLPHVPPNEMNSLLACEKCMSLMEDPTRDANHWRCLSVSMWSEYAPIQAMAYRILKKLFDQDWARDLSDQLYLDEETLNLAMAGISNQEEESSAKPTKDSNGNILADGDSVTLIKDLEVKGANFTAKRGTLVKNITLTGNPEHIEGRVNGTTIVLLTCYLKKV